MAADRSKYPVVHLVRQHPVGGCRSRVPYSRRSGWAHLLRLPDGETGIRKT
jgi:hypothetical protein